MSPLENKIKGKISIIILCAGEGSRLKQITGEIPKPLIRIKTLGDVPILQHTIEGLTQSGFEKIIIVKGHLGNKIDEFLTSLTQSHRDTKEKLILIDASAFYKLGPLYSFLAFTKALHMLTNALYLIMPGDTFFLNSFFNKITTFLNNNFRSLCKTPIVFYRTITVSTLKRKHQNSVKNDLKFISTVEIKGKGSQKVLLRIIQRDLKGFSDDEQIKQIIPLFLFPLKFINLITKLEQQTTVKTIREIINFAIDQGNEIIVEEFDLNDEFYDIDNMDDLIDLETILKNKEGQ